MAERRGTDSTPSRSVRPGSEAEAFALAAVRFVSGMADFPLAGDPAMAIHSPEDSAAISTLLTDAGWAPIDPTVLRQCHSLADIARLAQSPLSTPDGVAVLNASGSRPPVIAFPGAAGSALTYVWLARALGPESPVRVIEPGGMHGKGRVDFTVEAAALRSVSLLGDTMADEPICLVAYSASGMWAWETGRLLSERGGLVHLVLIDCTIGPPSGRRTDPRPPSRGQAARRSLVRTWLRIAPARTVPTTYRNRALFHAAVRARRSYVPQPRAFPVTLLHVAETEVIDDWRAIAENIDIIEVPGNHYTVLEPPNVDVVAAWVRAVTASGSNPDR